MLAFIAVAAMIHEDPERSPAIYRCPASEAESKFFKPFVNEDGFDTFCVEPKPGRSARAAAAGKVKFVEASKIDTKPNLAWRNATVRFMNGQISPRTWLATIGPLHETVHFLSSPKTPKLRSIAITDTSTLSARAVFGEMCVVFWPGTPCFTADDLGKTRYLPGPGAEESWLLAMNDYLGPMLSLRHDNPFLVTGTPTVVRADDKPGLLIFSQSSGKKKLTFYLNNGKTSVVLRPFDTEKAIVVRGLNLDAPKPLLMPAGSFIVDSSPAESR